eukprot:scaffold118448_cov33-Tisochrysis_lutea.AAC.1
MKKTLPHPVPSTCPEQGPRSPTERGADMVAQSRRFPNQATMLPCRPTLGGASARRPTLRTQLDQGSHCRPCQSVGAPRQPPSETRRRRAWSTQSAPPGSPASRSGPCRKARMLRAPPCSRSPRPVRRLAPPGSASARRPTPQTPSNLASHRHHGRSAAAPRSHPNVLRPRQVLTMPIALREFLTSPNCPCQTFRTPSSPLAGWPWGRALA